MLKFVVVVAIVTVGLFAVACGGGGEESTVSLSESPTPELTAAVTPSASATPSSTPSQDAVSLSDVAGWRVVVLRETEYRGQPGELWISYLDGTGGRRLTGDGEVGTWAGFAGDSEGGTETAYYIRVDGEASRSVWAVDLTSGVRSEVLSFEVLRQDWADASVSPDGRYVAYAHVDGIDVFDVVTGEYTHLLDNGPTECDAGSCFSHSQPRWSPSGALLMVRKTFWEGGTSIVVDPFADPLTLHTNDSPVGPYTSTWSTNDEAACGYGRYASPSGLYVAVGPGWEFENQLPEYEEYGSAERWVSDCSWLDEDRVVFGANVSRRDFESDTYVPLENSVEVLVFDRRTGQERLLHEVEGAVQIWTGKVLALAGTDLIVTQQFVDDAGAGSGVASRPELIDVENGDRLAVLQPGDELVAVIGP
ncbi:MAG: hypothetical protein IH957_06475 [Chloroflexi bacterium]|nr:hypothetical protein [Chloroflexota bacterium]